MRYTRTKQLIRLTYGKYWSIMPNERIDKMRELLSEYELDKSFKWSRWRMGAREINHVYLGEQIIVPMGNYKALKKAQREYLNEKLTKEDETNEIHTK